MHKGRCEWNEYHEVEAILDHRCDTMPVGLGETSFLIKWEGYGHKHNQWRPYDCVTKTVITEYLKFNGFYDHA